MTGKPVILVTGATGNQGSAVTKSLVEQGLFTVLALVRHRAGGKAQRLESLGAELVEGDFEDKTSLEHVLQGTHGVFSMQDFAHGAETEVRQGKRIADLAKKAGVNHFVYSSVGSANRQTGIPHFESKNTIEAHIRTIDLLYTCISNFQLNVSANRQVTKQPKCLPGLKRLVIVPIFRNWKRCSSLSHRLILI